MENLNVQIGDKLREAREAAGYTVADVVHHAHLPRSVIEALEAEDFSVFASPTYAKSFLNQYSEFLNVDAHPWLDALEPSTFVQTEGLKSIFEEPQISQKWEAPRSRKESGASHFSLILLMIITGGLAYAAYKGVEYMEKISADPAEPETAVKVVPGEPAAAVPVQKSAPPTPVPGAPAPEPEVAKKQDSPPSPPPRAIIVQD